MNACLRCSPRQGKSEAAKRLIFSRRWKVSGAEINHPCGKMRFLQVCPQTLPRAIRGRRTANRTKATRQQDT